MPKARRGSGNRSALIAKLEAGTLRVEDVFPYESTRTSSELANALFLFELANPGYRSYPRYHEEAGQGEGTKVMFVPLNKVKSDQGSVDNNFVRDIMDLGYATPRSYPSFIKFKGSYYIWNGNHRTVAAYLKGNKSIRGHVADLDKFMDSQ